MVLRTVGASLIARLMQAEAGGIDSAWLLYGPDDPDIIEPAEPGFEETWLLAAE